MQPSSLCSPYHATVLEAEGKQGLSQVQFKSHTNRFERGRSQKKEE